MHLFCFARYFVLFFVRCLFSCSVSIYCSVNGGGYLPSFMPHSDSLAVHTESLSLLLHVLFRRTEFSLRCIQFRSLTAVSLSWSHSVQFSLLFSSPLYSGTWKTKAIAGLNGKCIHSRVFLDKQGVTHPVQSIYSFNHTYLARYLCAWTVCPSMYWRTALKNHNLGFSNYDFDTFVLSVLA